MKKVKTSDDYLADAVCGNCRHWKRLDDVDQMPAEDLLGECLRYPPIVFGLTGDDEVIQAIPVTEARFGCGEHARVLN